MLAGLDTAAGAHCVYCRYKFFGAADKACRYAVLRDNIEGFAVIYVYSAYFYFVFAAACTVYCTAACISVNGAVCRDNRWIVSAGVIGIIF